MNRTNLGRQFEHGISLVEVLVSVTLGLLLLAGVANLFVTNKRTFNMIEQRGRLQENLRFSMNRMVSDIRLANYKGCQHDALLDSNNDGAEDFPIQGQDGSSTGPDRFIVRYRVPASATAININGTSVIVEKPHNLKSGDTIFLETCSGWDETARTISAISTGSSTDTVIINTSTTLTGSGFVHPENYFTASNSPKQPAATNQPSYVSNLYFISNNVLYVARDASSLTDESGADALIGYYTSDWDSNVAETGGTDVAQQDRVENMQLLYGVDSVNDDAVADSYVSASSVTDWNAVVSVKIALLLSTSNYDTAATGTTTYDLLGSSLTINNDRRQRKVVTATVQLRNRMSVL